MAELIDYMYELRFDGYHGTRRLNSPRFSAHADAKLLSQALTIKNTNRIIETLTARNNSQRLKINHEYCNLFSKNLIDDLKRVLNDGKSFRILEYLFMKPANFDAECLSKALRGGQEDQELVFTEIFMSRYNERKRQIKDIFKDKHVDGRSVQDEFSRHDDVIINLFLATLYNEERDESNKKFIEQSEALEIARNLHQAINNQEMEYLSNIFSSMSFHHLRAIIDKFYCIAGQDIRKAFAERFTGKLLKELFDNLIQFVLKPPCYFAEQLYQSLLMKDHNKTIRIFVSRAEVDLDLVKTFYMSTYQVTLEDAVRQHVAEQDFRNILIHLLR